MDTDFFADIVTTGTVLGADAELGPDGVVSVLGDDFEQNVNSSSMWRDYGLVKFFWHERPRGLGWQGSHFTVQADRLDQPVLVNELQAALDDALVPLREPQLGYQEYYQRESQMTVLVHAETGAVLHLSSVFRQLTDVRARNAGNRKTVLASLEQLLALDPKERNAWLEREQPAAEEWIYRAVSISGNALSWDRGLTGRDGWCELALWAWGNSLVPAELAAVQVAEFLALVENSFADDRPDRPSGDEVVRDCLAHVNGALTRTDKNLIDMAVLHRHAVQDGQLVAELDEWLGARTDVPRAELPRL